MNKSLLIGLTLSSSLLLTACGTKEETLATSETPTETAQQDILPLENEITMTCTEAIQSYLATANFEGVGDSVIQADDAIVVDYI
jgi:uncharacterized lipoprotein YajG